MAETVVDAVVPILDYDNDSRSSMFVTQQRWITEAHPPPDRTADALRVSDYDRPRCLSTAN
jgi:hypothetical protein